MPLPAGPLCLFHRRICNDINGLGLVRANPFHPAALDPVAGLVCRRRRLPAPVRGGGDARRIRAGARLRVAGRAEGEEERSGSDAGPRSGAVLERPPRRRAGHARPHRRSWRGAGCGQRSRLCAGPRPARLAGTGGPPDRCAGSAAISAIGSSRAEGFCSSPSTGIVGTSGTSSTCAFDSWRTGSIPSTGIVTFSRDPFLHGAQSGSLRDGARRRLAALRDR